MQIAYLAKVTFIYTHFRLLRLILFSQLLQLQNSATHDRNTFAPSIFSRPTVFRFCAARFSSLRSIWESGLALFLVSAFRNSELPSLFLLAETSDGNIARSAFFTLFLALSFPVFLSHRCLLSPTRGDTRKSRFTVACHKSCFVVRPRGGSRSSVVANR